jgi:AcrR family transcriptional regulator
MARIIKEGEYAARRNQILDVAQRLLYTKGYETMTIQDMLDGLRMSKGAFYHYFASKEAVLEALTDRMTEQAMLVLRPIEQDPELRALEKLRHYLAVATEWKTARRDVLIGLVRVWYHDANIVAREKYFQKSIKLLAPFLTAVISQGVQEGEMHTRYPEQAAEVAQALFLTMAETLQPLLLEAEPTLETAERAERVLAVYQDALEGILGVPRGSLPLVEPGVMEQWVRAPQPAAAEPDTAPAETLAAV